MTFWPGGTRNRPTARSSSTGAPRSARRSTSSSSPGGELLGLEVKAASSVGAGDFRRLESGRRLRFRVREDDVIEVEPETVALRLACRATIDMQFARNYADRMSKTLQVRGLPEEVHRALKARAALAGLSLSEYVLQELERVVARPSRKELYERLRRREPVELDVSVAEIIASERLAR